MAEVFGLLNVVGPNMLGYQFLVILARCTPRQVWAKRT